MTAKTGGWNTAWVELERPKPPPITGDYARYWLSPPPERSERCAYWVRQIQRGWRPSRRITMEGRDGAAVWYGVWLWEYLNVIYPALVEAEDQQQ